MTSFNLNSDFFSNSSKSSTNNDLTNLLPHQDNDIKKKSNEKEAAPIEQNVSTANATRNEHAHEKSATPRPPRPPPPPLSPLITPLYIPFSTLADQQKTQPLCCQEEGAKEKEEEEEEELGFTNTQSQIHFHHSMSKCQNRPLFNR